MATTNEFLVRNLRSSDCKRRWPCELKARIVAEKLLEDATVNGAAKQYSLMLRSVSDWRHMGRTGKLVLPDLDGMDFEPAHIADPKPLEVLQTPPLNLTSVELLKGGATIRLAADTPAAHFAEIVL